MKSGDCARCTTYDSVDHSSVRVPASAILLLPLIEVPMVASTKPNGTTFCCKGILVILHHTHDDEAHGTGVRYLALTTVSFYATLIMSATSLAFSISLGSSRSYSSLAKS